MDVFGKLNPKIMDDYQADYNRRTKEKYELADFQAWRIGIYMINAIQTAFDPKKAKYPEQPYSMKKSDEVQTHPEIQARRFEDWANTFNRNFINKQSSKASD